MPAPSRTVALAFAVLVAGWTPACCGQPADPSLDTTDPDDPQLETETVPPADPESDQYPSD